MREKRSGAAALTGARSPRVLVGCALPLGALIEMASIECANPTAADEFDALTLSLY